MSMFNPETFMQQSVSGKLSTSIPAIPEMETTAYIQDVSVRSVKDSVIMDVKWGVGDERAKAATGLNEPTVRQSIFLDLNDNGVLDTSDGKNLQLGRLREALGQNDGGAWQPTMLIGKTARIHIVQRPDKNDPSRIYNDVKAVAKL